MTRRKIFVSLVLPAIVLLVGTVAGQTPKPPERLSEGTGSLSGRVLTPAGDSMAGINLAIQRSEGGGWTNVVTDEAGRFTAAGLAAGLYRIRLASGRSYKGLILDESTPESAVYRLGESVTIRLRRGGVITGRVTNELGEPLALARVFAQRLRTADERPARGDNSVPETVTDDRGVYRLYGLPPGAYAIGGGGGTLRFIYPPPPNPLSENRTITYHPSSSRAAATEVVVRAGEETTGVDVRVRGEIGHALSGTVTAGGKGNVSARLALVLNGTVEHTQSVFGPTGKIAFSFPGIPDGEYDLCAIGGTVPDGARQVSAPVRVVVRGADVTGIDLTLAPTASVSGQIVFAEPPERSADCAKLPKSDFLPAEIGVSAHREAPPDSKNLVALVFPDLQGDKAVDAKGNFTCSGLFSGRHRLGLNLPDEDWYVKDVREPRPAVPKKAVLDKAGTKADDGNLAGGFELKAGEERKNVTVTIGRGAAGVTGRVFALKPGGKLPAKLRVHVIPAGEDDPGRYYEALVAGDGTFALRNLAPGKYWLVAKELTEAEGKEPELRPLAWTEAERKALRKEARPLELDLTPCARVANAIVPYAGEPKR